MSNLLAALIGLLAGLLVNYLADILPVRRRLTKPLCLNCGQTQPLGNYLFWPRRCVNCGKQRTSRTWVVEILSTGTAVWLWNSPEAQQRLGIILGGLLLVYFAVIVVIDYEHRLILNPTSIFGAIFGFLMGIKLYGWTNSLIGGLVGYGLMFALYYLGYFFTKLMARVQGRSIDEVALGFGDVNLTGVLGLILGWPNIVIALFLSVLSAGIVGALLMIGKMISRNYRSFMLAMPYGPFLILGAFLMLYLPAFTQKLLERISPLF
jgi:leader peptidase (prepilin peptidase) / N-methyltransferase